MNAHIGQDGIERHRELAGPIADGEPEFRDAIAEIPHQVADLSQERSKRHPILGGLINEYERAA